jgi:RNA recognition motif-containing protein
MATQLFVGKLSFDTTEDALRALFAKYGTVASAKIIIDRGTNQSKGFGFVEMEDQQAAQSAINALDGQEFEGRTIAVNVARPREERPAGGNNFRGGFQPRR